MTKDMAIRETRIAALYQGGTFYVVRKVAAEYRVVASDVYKRRMGSVALTFTPDKVRMTTPPNRVA